MSDVTRSDEAREEVPEELQEQLDELAEELVVEGEPEQGDAGREPGGDDELEPGDR